MALDTLPPPAPATAEPLLRDDPALLAGYNADDYSRDPGHATFLARPADAGEVQALLAWAAATGTPVTASGGRTSLVAGATAPAGLVLSTEKLTTLALDAGARRVRVGAGLKLGELAAVLAPHRLQFPPDPTSRDDASVGGALACNASGARTCAHGPTRAWVAVLEIVLPGGHLLTIERGARGADDGRFALRAGDRTVELALPELPWPQSSKHACGYHHRRPLDLIDVFIGAEGTLGVVTAATLRLRAIPAGRFQLMVAFPTRRQGIAFAALTRERGLKPTSLEWVGGNALTDEFPAGMHGAGVVVIVEDEYINEPALERWESAIAAAGGSSVVAALDERDIERFRLMRHSVPDTVNQRALENGCPKMSTDWAVPHPRLGEMWGFCRGLLGDFPRATYGHLGDAHFHVNLLPETPAGVAEAKRLLMEMCRQAVALGGTVSAEHGIGKTKHHLLEAQYGAEGVAAMRRVKAALDPEWLLAPGNLFPATVTLR